MARLILEPTSVGQWQTLVQEAEAACELSLDEHLESYLVYLLMRFTDRPDCTGRLMAQDYLESQLLSGKRRAERLREVGDHCLLFSGMFPQLAERRTVRIGYFVRIGRSSYQELSAVLDRGWSRMYGRLSEAFVVLVDILHAMRELGGAQLLSPVQAMDFWQETGSRRSFRQLCGDDDRLPGRGNDETH